MEHMLLSGSFRSRHTRCKSTSEGGRNETRRPVPAAHLPVVPVESEAQGTVGIV